MNGAGVTEPGWPLPRTPAGGPPPWLASVRDAGEASLAMAAGAAIIDAKEPRQGALGALPPCEVAAIVAQAGGRLPVSATVGDLPLAAAGLAPAMLAMAAAGVDIVKLGIFTRTAPQAIEDCLAALPAVLPNGRAGAARVAVLMADRVGADWPLQLLARHGFAGVMLDTADKSTGGLRGVLPEQALAGFLARARACGLRAGLAGSLTLADIAPLAALWPDFLGFRGALCRHGARTAGLDAAACAAVAGAFAALPSAQDAQPGLPTSRTRHDICRA